jgi:hypothetical protein
MFGSMGCNMTLKPTLNLERKMTALTYSSNIQLQEQCYGKQNGMFLFLAYLIFLLVHSFWAYIKEGLIHLFEEGLHVPLYFFLLLKAKHLVYTRVLVTTKTSSMPRGRWWVWKSGSILGFT